MFTRPAWSRVTRMATLSVSVWEQRKHLLWFEPWVLVLHLRSDDDRRSRKLVNAIESNWRMWHHLESNKTWHFVILSIKTIWNVTPVYSIHKSNKQHNSKKHCLDPEVGRQCHCKKYCSLYTEQESLLANSRQSSLSLLRQIHFTSSHN